MPAQDIAVSDILIIIDPKYDGRISDIVANLKSAGVEVSNVNEDEGVIEGTVAAAKIPQVRKIDGVDYVRTVFTYIDHQPDGGM